MQKKFNQVIKEIIGRWTDKIYPSKEAFETVLRSGKKMVVYYGIDPTAPHLHLGHSTNLFLLKKLQQLGHKIILLIGDFTAQIGDPTGRQAARKPLTKKEILKNYRTYKKQAEKILDFKSKKNPAKIKFNSQWLNKLKPEEIIRLASHFTHGQMVKRNMFQERIKEGKEIYLNEFLYPLLQGYDSVTMNVDVEIGGTDQTFNMLVGRDLMKIYRNKEKFVVTTPLLENTKTGKKLMSKTENFIGLDFQPDNMYGKIMALPDEVIISCFKLCTEIPMEEIEKIERKMKTGVVNPREAKAKLAREIVNFYHGEKIAAKAEKEFERIFKEKKAPSEVPAIKVNKKSFNIVDLLLHAKLSSSKSEARRLISQNGVRINGNLKNNWQENIEIKKGMILKVGKRKFVKILI